MKMWVLEKKICFSYTFLKQKIILNIYQTYKHIHLMDSIIRTIIINNFHNLLSIVKTQIFTYKMTFIKFLCSAQKSLLLI